MNKLLPLLLLAACAPYNWYQNGEPRTWDDHNRAYADCERAVGGQNYVANIAQCLKDRGWVYGP